MAQFNSDESGPNDYERKSRLARFEGSGAISSSDYFGRDEGGGGGSSGPGRAGSADFDVSAGELINKLSFQVPKQSMHSRNQDGRPRHARIAALQQK